MFKEQVQVLNEENEILKHEVDELRRKLEKLTGEKMEKNGMDHDDIHDTHDGDTNRDQIDPALLNGSSADKAVNHDDDDKEDEDEEEEEEEQSKQDNDNEQEEEDEEESESEEAKPAENTQQATKESDDNEQDEDSQVNHNDDAALINKKDNKVFTFEGDYQNIKITTKKDLETIKSIMNKKFQYIPITALGIDILSGRMLILRSF